MLCQLIKAWCVGQLNSSLFWLVARSPISIGRTYKIKRAKRSDRYDKKKRCAIYIFPKTSLINIISKSLSYLPNPHKSPQIPLLKSPKPRPNPTNPFLSFRLHLFLVGWTSLLKRLRHVRNFVEFFKISSFLFGYSTFLFTLCGGISPTF